MKLYRTICNKEFVSLLLGEEIQPKKQEASVCIRILDGKEVSAYEQPFHAICTFRDKIYWPLEQYNQYILLELEVSEEKILYEGHGIYGTPYYNNHFSEDSKWITDGCSGQARRFYKSYKVPEIYISSYNYKDVNNVYFMNGCNLNHSLQPRELSETFVFNDVLFSDYIGEVCNLLRQSILLSEQNILDNKFLEWMLLFYYNSEKTSLRTFKKFLMKTFPDMSIFISKFKYYNSVDTLGSILAKGNVAYESFLDASSILSVLEDVYNPVYGLSFVNLEESSNYPEEVEKTFLRIIDKIKEYMRYGVDTLDISGKEQEIKSLIYTLLIDTKILKETV